MKLHPGQVSLTCDTIGDQDNGIARHLIDSEITKAVNDLDDRGEEDGKPRKVSIELELPIVNGLVVMTVEIPTSDRIRGAVWAMIVAMAAKFDCSFDSAAKKFVQKPTT